MPAKETHFSGKNSANISQLKFKMFKPTQCFFVIFFCFFLLSTCAPKPYQPPEKLYVFDVGHLHLNHQAMCDGPCQTDTPPPNDKTHADLLDDYDRLIFLSSLQGLVNKKQARLYLIHHPTDEFWLETYQTPNQPYGWLSQTELVTLPDFEAVLNQFQGDISGLVAWDTAVPASLNVATTLAGAEGWPIVRVGSALANSISHRWPIQQSLAGLFDDQLQAYQWAIDNYLAQGKTNAAFLAYVLDGWPAAQYEQGLMTRGGVYALERDYIIQQGGFAFDLSPWRDEAPAEAELFAGILQANRTEAGLRLSKVWGFIPWYEKYASAPGAGGSNHPVQGEWESTWNFSYYASYLQGGGGDAWGVAMANISVHKFGPKPKTVLPYPKPPSQAGLIRQGYLLGNGRVNPNKTFLLFYAGDYDLVHPSLVGWGGWERSTWVEAGRGDIPIAWGINPGMEEDIPAVMSYILATRTANDYLVGANSGAGYVNPQAISRRYRGQWLARSKDYYHKYGLNVQGFLLNGRGYDLPLDWIERFAKLAPLGVISPDFETPEDEWPFLVNGTPYTGMIRETLGDSVYGSANNIHLAYKRLLPEGRSAFIAVRSSFQRPDFLSQVYAQAQADEAEGRILDEEGHPLDPGYELVDPYTFFELLRISLEDE